MPSYYDAFLHYSLSCESPFLAFIRWKYSALRSLTNCQLRNTWMMSSALLHGPCTPPGSCGLMVSWDAGDCPATGVPCGRSVEAHLCRSGLVGFYYIHRPSANWWYFPPSEQSGLWTSDSPTFEAFCSSADAGASTPYKRWSKCSIEKVRGEVFAAFFRKLGGI